MCRTKIGCQENADRTAPGDPNEGDNTRRTDVHTHDARRHLLYGHHELEFGDEPSVLAAVRHQP